MTLDDEEVNITRMRIGFDTLLSLQQQLQVNTYGVDPFAMLGDEKIEFMRWNAFALLDELHEAMNEVGWKPWATSRHIHVEAFAAELVDLLHFFGNLCLAAGVTSDMLAEGYVNKRRKNAERQEQGYDGLKEKCPRCRRSYDDVGAVTLAAHRICIPCYMELPRDRLRALEGADE